MRAIPNAAGVRGSGENGCGAARAGGHENGFCEKGGKLTEKERHLRICGRDFLVCWDEKLVDSAHQGEISFRTEEIRLCPTIASYRHRTQSTILHELIEAAIFYSDIQMEHDDLSRLAPMLYS